MNLLEHKKALTAVGVVSTAVSAACWGYLFGRREAEETLNSEIEDILAVESEKIRRFYSTMYKDVQPEDVSELDEDPVVDSQHIIIPKEALATKEGRARVIQELSKAIDEGAEETDEPDAEPELEEVNLIAETQAPPKYDLEALMNERSPDKPYIISKDEYLRNEANFEEQQLTFYEGDGVLMDEDDDAIPDTESVVGDKNLQRFGVMSEDNNTVYIQNDRIETIFQVTRSFMTASAAIFGPDADEEANLAHSSMKRRRPRREE